MQSTELTQILDQVGSVHEEIKAALSDGKLELMEIVPIVLKVVRAVESVTSNTKLMGPLKLELARLALVRIFQESGLNQAQTLVAMRFLDTHVPFIIASAVQAQKLVKRIPLRCCC